MEINPSQRGYAHKEAHGDGPVTSSVYQRIMIAEGCEEHSVIQLKNLSANALVGSDIWGSRDATGYSNRFQPILLSARLSLQHEFSSSAENDHLDDSTVNYGTLSKEILKLAAIRGTSRKDPTRPMGIERDWSLFDFLEVLFRCLTGSTLVGDGINAAHTFDVLRGGDIIRGHEHQFSPPLLSSKLLLEIDLRIALPKGTLLSHEVSLRVRRGFLHHDDNDDPYTSTLQIKGIQIPTLIGINSNERLAKQFVSATVEIDPYHCIGSDTYNHLEQIVAKSMEESSFETLETLATHLADRVIKHFVYAYNNIGHGSTVKITLEKPSATTFAETPIISIIRSSDPAKGVAKQLWEERQAVENPPRLEFPHQGRLDEWIKAHFPGDSTTHQQRINLERLDLG